MDTKLEIFRPGSHRAMNGQTYDFSDKVAREIVDGYDPARHEAPIVVGHPRTDDPAYGWVASLDYADSTVVAEPRQVDPAFADIVNAGKYKKMSASFFTPKHASNPTPGKYYLKHVGFLGAVPPAVKGLKSANFADDEDTLTIEFSEGAYRDGIIVRILRGIRDLIIDKHGQEAADKAVSTWDLDHIAETAAQEKAEDSSFADPDTPAPKAATETSSEASSETAAEEAANPADASAATDSLSTDPSEEKPAMADTPTEKDIADKQAALDAREAKLKADETAFAEKQKEALHEENTAFADTLVKDGRLAPGKKDAVIAFMDNLTGEEEVSFADGENKETPLAFFKGLLETGGQVVNLAEASAPEDTPDAGAADFAAGDGDQVDQERLELHRKAEALSQKDNISYDQAVDRLIP